MADRDQEFRPLYAVPPGSTLEELLVDRGMTQTELARRMGRPLKTINEIIQAKAAITPETSIQLERVLGWTIPHIDVTGIGDGDGPDFIMLCLLLGAVRLLFFGHFAVVADPLSDNLWHDAPFNDSKK